MEYGLLKVLVRRFVVTPYIRSTCVFSILLLTFILFVRLSSHNANQSDVIFPATFRVNEKRYEMVRMNRSVRQLIEGNTPVAPAQSVRAPPGSTLLSSVGFSYVVRRVQESTVKETNPLLSDAHIHYAMKRVGMTDTVNPNSVVNPHPFNYIINNENLCGADLGSDVFILVYVHSAPENTARRALIRATWGNRKHYFPRKMRLIFVLGKSSTPALMHILMNESSIHNDIVQSTFIDAYRNITYKAISALKWVSLYCRNAKFVLKSDDDILVNPTTLMNYLAVDTPVKGLIICKVYERGIVFRAGYRRLVRRDEYAGDHYPPFCSGSAHVMTTDVVIALFQTSYTVEFFWPDDVFITGLLPFKLDNITFVQVEEKVEVLKTDRAVEASMTGDKRARYIFGHIHDMDIFMKAWLKIVSLT